MANGRSDGTVYIDTKIDTSGISKGMNDAGKKIGTVLKSVEKFGDIAHKVVESIFSKGIDTSASSTNLAKLQAEIKRTEMQLDKLIEKQIRFVETGGNIKSRTMAGMEYDIEMTRNKLEQLRQTLANTTQDAPRRFERMKKSIDKVTKSISNLNKGTKKTHMSLLRMLGTSLLFSTVFRAISTVTKGFKEGMENITQYSDEANASMSKLKSALTQLKNSFAAAFSPILTAVTPALVSFINLISRAMNTVAAFFAALSGKTTYTKAVEVQEDYREALEGTAEAAKDAKKYLTGLDEIRTFTADDVPTTTGGGGSTGDMFEEEEIDSPILKFAERIKKIFDEVKQYIKDGDWEGLGAYISDGIVAGLKWINKKLEDYDWEGLGNDIGEFLKGIKWIDVIKEGFKLKFNIWKAIAEVWFGAFTAAPIETTIITALAGLKFTGLGSILAGKIAKSIFSIASWKKAFDFVKGIKLIPLLTQVFSTMNPGMIGELGLKLSDLFNGSFLDPLTWDNWLGDLARGLHNSVNNFIDNVIGPLIMGLFEGLASFIANVFNFDTTKELIDGTKFFFQQAKDDFTKRDWASLGTDIVSGIIGGLLSALSFITEPFYDLFKWIWDGICKIFGIHSPAKEMEPIGTNILEGVVVGFKDAISSFTKAITEWWNNGVKPWFTKEKWIGIIGGIKEAFVGKWNEVVSWWTTNVTSWWNNSVKPWFTKEKWFGILGGIKSAFSDGFKSATNAAIDLINKFINQVNSKLNIKWEAFNFMGAELFPAGNFQLFSIPNIPKLATGAVIPPNAPFLAMLGDQRHGNNLEMPEDLLRKVVREESGRNSGNGATYHFVAQIDRRTLFEEIIEQARISQAAYGENLLVTL